MTMMDISVHQREAFALPLAPALRLSEKEQTLLQLCDRFQHLQLAIATLQAQQARAPGIISINGDVDEVQNETLEAGAACQLKHNVVEGCIAVNPILKAVHRATHASPIERDLQPLIERRDEVSVTITRQASETGIILDQLADAEVEALRLSRRNASLAMEVLQLVGNADRVRISAEEGTRTSQQTLRLHDNVKSSRRRWQVMKGTACAIVVGSGVDWIDNPELRHMVLDPE